MRAYDPVLEALSEERDTARIQISLMHDEDEPSAEAIAAAGLRLAATERRIAEHLRSRADDWAGRGGDSDDDGGKRRRGPRQEPGETVLPSTP